MNAGKTTPEHYTGASGSSHQITGDVKLEIITNEVSPNNNDLLNEHCESHVIKSEPSFYQDEELDEAYYNQFDSSTVQCEGETSESEAEKGVTVLARSSDCTNKDQMRKLVKTELSCQEQGEELFSLAELAGQVQSSPLIHPPDEKCNELLNRYHILSRFPEKQVTKPYGCDQCNKSFSNSGHLNEHKRTHTCEKPFSCDQCNKSFACARYLVEHKRTHTGEKPYSCDQCNKSFSNNGNFRRHKRTHTGEKPYSCDQCNKSFVSTGNLVEHKRTHTGEKPYSCGQCNKSFSFSGNFNSHKRTHTGEKPHSCDQCNKSFISTGNLFKHKRTHTGDKPYSCDQCNKPFSRSDSLLKHKRTHSVEKPTVATSVIYHSSFMDT